MSTAKICAAALLCGVTGCAVGPSYRAPAADTPAHYVSHTGMAGSGPEAPAPSPDLATWWRELGDTELNSLVERAIKANLDLDIALTRLQQARTYQAVVLGHALPQVDGTAAAARGTGSDLSRGRAEQGLRSADNSSGLAHINTVAGFDAVWELDVFGKYRREFEAAHYDMQAAAAARNGVLTSVVADVVRTYVDLRGFQLRAGILRSASDVLRESLRIVNIRYQRGITNELDVALAKRELAAVEAQIAPVEAEEGAAKYALAVLLGEYPDAIIQELATPGLIPTMPGPVQPGVPLDLLRRRPDIQQAERELAGATARVGVATANLFPQISVVGPRAGYLAQHLEAHLVVRAGRDMAPAGFWRPRRAGERRRSRGSREAGYLSQDHFERRAGRGYLASGLFGAAGTAAKFGRRHVVGSARG